MGLNRIFFLTMSLFFLIWAFAAIDSFKVKENPLVAFNEATKAQVDEIDRQIEELRAMKRGFESRVLKHEDYAQRLQFEDRAYLETRRHLELAEENRIKAQRVQLEIDRLETERRKLLQ